MGTTPAAPNQPTQGGGIGASAARLAAMTTPATKTYEQYDTDQDDDDYTLGPSDPATDSTQAQTQTASPGATQEQPAPLSPEQQAAGVAETQARQQALQQQNQLQQRR